MYIREDEAKQKHILGFYAIRCSSLIIDDTDNGEREGEPAVEILELAVHKDFRRQGIGTKLIQDIFNRAMFLKNNYIGIKHLLVCAKQDAAPFYQKFGIQEIANGKQIPRNHDNQNCIGMSVKLAYTEQTDSESTF